MIELNSRFIIERPIGCEWLVRQGEKTYEVDLAIIHTAESRTEELAHASGNVAELASCFDRAYDSACKLHAMTQYEAEMATIASRKRRAIILKDILPGRIKERGLSSARSPVGAEDIRDTLYYEDDEFVRVEQYRAALDAIKELLFGKMMTMNSARRRAEAMLNRGTTKPGAGNDDPLGDRVERAYRETLEQAEVAKNANVTVAPRRRGGWGTPKDE